MAGAVCAAGDGRRALLPGHCNLPQHARPGAPPLPCSPSPRSARVTLGRRSCPLLTCCCAPPPLPCAHRHLASPLALSLIHI
eukprot:1943569-Rhodomonas_salina.4